MSNKYELNPIVKYKGPAELKTNLIMRGRDLLEELERTLQPGLMFRHLKRHYPDGISIHARTIELFPGARVDHLTIEAPEGVEEEKEKKIIEGRPFELVAIVELVVFGGTELKGFAIFPLTEGQYADAEEEAVGWGDLVAVTTTLNIGLNQDPLGLAYQETNRIGWCKTTEANMDIEQLPRLDQGYLSYDGDSGFYGEEYEVTEISAVSDVWTWERNEDYENAEYQWESVEPGPPPESMCGYTWSIGPEHGGPAEGTEEHGDYHDERHLFYMLERGDGKYAVFWPPNFNQKIVKWFTFSEGAYLCRSVDDELMWDEIYDGWSSMHVFGVFGCPQADTIVFVNSLSNIYADDNGSVRLWGVVWGSEAAPCADYTTGAGDEFPYLNPEYTSSRTTYGMPGTDYVRFWGSGGVYVDGIHRENYIQGCHRYIDYYRDNPYYEYDERVQQIPEDRFVYPEQLTAEQLTLLEGNTSMTEDWLPASIFPPYARTWGIHDADYSEPPQVTVLVGGQDYFIHQSEVVADFWARLYGTGNWTRFIYSNEGDWDDYGIFTTDRGVVDQASRMYYSDLVDPTTLAYAYAYYHDIEYQGSERVCYGVVYQGKHYRSPWFDLLTDDEFNRGVVIPGLEGVTDSEGNPLYGDLKIRVGTMTRIVTAEI